MIRIKPSPTADTRTCDFARVSKDTLLESSRQHINDVRQGLAFFQGLLGIAAALHDTDKITDIDGFHADFVAGNVAHGEWLKRHYALNRHHLNTSAGIREDVNLIDVLDFIADIGHGRRGAREQLSNCPAARSAGAGVPEHGGVDQESGRGRGSHRLYSGRGGGMTHEEARQLVARLAGRLVLDQPYEDTTALVVALGLAQHALADYVPREDREKALAGFARATVYELECEPVQSWKAFHAARRLLRLDTEAR